MNESGKKGEKFVAEYLENQGFKVSCINNNNRYGEVDIIVEDEKYIVFVEVKLRKKNSLIRGIEAVNKSKRIKIIKTALIYLMNYKCTKQPRFDVAELFDSQNGLTINYLKNAFDTEELDEFF